MTSGALLGAGIENHCDTKSPRGGQNGKRWHEERHAVQNMLRGCKNRQMLKFFARLR